jgi:hypothetical protein
MRLIVGPLPAAVYWRRRAIVLGALLLAVLMTSYACVATAKSGASRPSGTTATSSKSPPAATGTGQPAESSSPQVIAPAAEVTPTATPEPTLDPNLCTDDELKVTAVPARTSLAQGDELNITLLIKNTSNRSCSRDVGADLQELRIVQGTEKIWSSDDCGGLRGHELRQFPVGHERSYSAFWNGKSSSACAKSMKRTPDGPVPPAGEYTIIGRVGTDLSSPVTIKLT